MTTGATTGPETVRIGLAERWFSLGVATCTLAVAGFLLARLTARERQVLDRIVAGRLNKQIADDLGISIKTVEAHRANIMDKLQARSMADLMKTALRAGS